MPVNVAGPEEVDDAKEVVAVLAMEELEELVVFGWLDEELEVLEAVEDMEEVDVGVPELETVVETMSETAETEPEEEETVKKVRTSAGEEVI